MNGTVVPVLAAALGAAAMTVAAEAQRVRLVPLEKSRLIASASYASIGVTGRNKPDGWFERLRREVPATLPAAVPRTRGGLELFVADRAGDGWLALYRTPLGESLPGRNARFSAVLFRADGSRAWELELNRFLSRPRGLEIQDIRFHEGRLYFNEACETYAREAGGRCSSLVRLNPAGGGKVEWRTRPLVSNNVFQVEGPYLFAGYGFTGEPDSVHVVSVRDGRVLASARLDSAHRYLEASGDRLTVVSHGQVYRFRVAR